MRKVGFSAPPGFQASPGAIGSRSRAAISKLMCSRLWWRGCQRGRHSFPVVFPELSLEEWNRVYAPSTAPARSSSARLSSRR